MSVEAPHLLNPAFREYVDLLVRRFERPDFVLEDPIGIPHGFDDPRDREVIGLFAALLAWGRRSTIVMKLEDLCRRMHWRPHAFVREFRQDRDSHRLADFGHRTFRPDDAVALTSALSRVLDRYGSLEAAFAAGDRTDAETVGDAIESFSTLLLTVNPDAPQRLRKHVSRPSTGSACKRLNLYLRWMVRMGPVDLCTWTAVDPSRLLMPLDVHSGRQARALGLLDRRANDWKATLELTSCCRALFPDDPVRCDYALFGAGVTGTPLDPRFTVSGDQNSDQPRRASSPPTTR